MKAFLLPALLFLLSLAPVCVSAQTVNHKKAEYENIRNQFLEEYFYEDSIVSTANIASYLIDSLRDVKEPDSTANSIGLKYSIDLLRKSISGDKVFINAYLNTGIAFFRLMESDSAMAYADMTRYLYPGNPSLIELYYNVGVSYYYNKDNEKAVKAWQICLKLKPHYELAESALTILKKDGVKIKSDAHVLEEYTATVKFDSDYSFYMNRANVKHKYKDYEGAIADYTKAMDFNTNMEYLYFTRGGDRMNIHNYRGAIEDFDMVIEKYRYNETVFWFRGEARRQIKDYKGAVLDYTLAINMNDAFAPAYTGRGTIFIAIGEKESGCADLHAAKELGAKDIDEYIKIHCH